MAQNNVKLRDRVRYFFKKIERRVFYDEKLKYEFHSNGELKVEKVSTRGEEKEYQYGEKGNLEFQKIENKITKESEEKEYYESGEVKAVKKFNLNSLCPDPIKSKEYYENGNLKSEVIRKVSNVAENEFSVKREEYYENGEVKEVHNLKAEGIEEKPTRDNKKIEKLENGNYQVEFWHNDKTFERSIYPNENIDEYTPLERNIFENNQLSLEEVYSYEKNEKVGKVYLENGEKEAIILTKYNDGIAIIDDLYKGTEVVEKREYRDVNTWELEKEENFSKEGTLKNEKIYENENLKEIHDYSKDILNVEYQKFHENGAKKEVGYYLKETGAESKIGECSFYTEEGNQCKKINFNTNEEWNYDNNKNLVNYKHETEKEIISRDYYAQGTIKAENILNKETGKEKCVEFDKRGNEEVRLKENTLKKDKGMEI